MTSTPRDSTAFFLSHRAYWIAAVVLMSVLPGCTSDEQPATSDASIGAMRLDDQPPEALNWSSIPLDERPALVAEALARAKTNPSHASAVQAPRAAADAAMQQLRQAWNDQIAEPAPMDITVRYEGSAYLVVVEFYS